ncbi:amino acid ABC transporter substrate-binding protein [Roseospira marina]|uniref:Amino acid ABC transporter substrate-binding protein n=1 Tax=Roseospira marina TaxID=140057 RepID=A0A5M6I893_9PROT|nr:transporter substrate-binding domain-containing protein [Roseospira marina]KAA5604466.1 amino acid ABC transporter substrate-binding protein [Roseospira marina]MBB4315512.1 polar amino acid transport system substrate-binding protein [Roseospira marina]MBB5088551.1 polar amino acid transport system substrate-binding protein [Roseospira marina]
MRRLVLWVGGGPLLLLLLLRPFGGPIGGATWAGADGLRLGTDEWSPYEYRVGNSVAGIATNIVLAVLESMQVPIEEVRVYPWGRAVRLAEAGDIDLAYSGVLTEDRRDALWFPETPLIESEWVVAVRAADRARFPFSSWDDLKRGRVGVVRGYRYGDPFDTFLKQNVTTEVVDQNYQNLLMLQGGRIDYAVCDFRNCAHLIEKNALQNTLHIYTDRIAAQTRYYAMFSKKTVSADFVARFDAHLRALRDSPGYIALTQPDLQGRVHGP